MQNVKLNLIPGSVMPVVNVSQYDKARQFSLTVYEGSATYSLTGKDVQIRGTKPDGNGFAYDSTDGVVSVSGSTVTISTTQQMTAVGGQTMVELRITQSGVILGTLNFILMVEPSALSDDTPISDTDIPAIERDFEAALAEAEADALKAEGYAVGTQDGTPAQSGEPYYQDNAKYYKEQAEAAASGGGADALKAEGYAVGTQNGVPVTSGSPYYHNNAAYYEGEASTSATNAGNSETAAAGSASAASADALKSEGFAVGEQNGTPVSSGSPYYQNNAEYYCQQASQYATGGLIFKGSVAFASIPTTGMVNGDMYNITDDFTTDNRFIEGAGVSVKAGANIAWIAGGTDKWDVLATGGGSNVASLDDLTDVSITTPADGDSLEYDATSQDWINGKRKLDLADYETLGAWNLIKNEGTTQSINNVTFTVNSDGSVGTNNNTVTGSNAYFTFYTSKTKFKAGTYYLSGCPSGGGWSTYAILLRCSDDGVTWTLTDGDIGSGDEVVLSADKYIKIEICVYLGASTGGVTFYPMLALKPGLPYAPYAMTNRELTEFSSGVAPIENGATSDNTYYTGMHFIRNGVLCTCINTINAGGAFSLNANYIESEKLTKRLYDVAFLRASYTPMRSVLLPNTTKTYLTIPNSKYQVILMVMSINGGQYNFIGFLARRYDDALFKVVFGGTDLVASGVIVCENTGATGLTIKVPNASGGAAFWILNLSGQSLGDIISGTYT